MFNVVQLISSNTDEEGNYQVSFLGKSIKSGNFSFLHVKVEVSIHSNSMTGAIPKPHTQILKRRQGIYNFYFHSDDNNMH